MIRPDYRIRHATAEDLPSLGRALAWAIEWRSPSLGASPEDVIRDTGHEYLLGGWGRPGDVAVVAEVSAAVVGAAWCRLWTGELHSYGYVDDATPEIAIGVEPAWRGRGVGTELLKSLFAAASSSGVARLSLSVEGDNPAMALYEQLGFVQLELVDASWTMVKELHERDRQEGSC